MSREIGSIMRKVDLRRSQSVVRDQGMRPTCLAIAATGGHEYLRGDGHCLSVEYLHWTCINRDGASEQGVSLKTTIQSLLEVGQPYEELWPYQHDIDDMATNYEPPNTIHPEDCFKVNWGAEIRPSIDDIKWHLRVGRAVVIGIRLFYDFHSSENGHIQMPKAGEASCGRHAVLLVGYNDDEQRFIFKNSWGGTWAESGYGFLPYSYIVEHTLAAHVFSNEELGE